MIDITNLANMFSQKPGAQPSMANSDIPNLMLGANQTMSEPGQNASIALNKTMDSANVTIV